MDAAVSQNPFRRVGIPLLCFASVLISTLMFPLLSLPWALLMPLLICPGLFSMGTWFSLAMPLAPSLGMLLAGGEVAIAVLLLPFSYFSLLTAVVARKYQFDFSEAVLWHTLSIFAAEALVFTYLSLEFGGNIFHGLANFLTQAVADSPQGDLYLYTWVRMGVLPLPAQMTQAAVALLEPSAFLFPELKIELLNDLRFQLFAYFRQTMPSMAVQFSLITGTFTALRTLQATLRKHPRAILILIQNDRGEIESHPCPPPRFAMLSFPPAYHTGVLVLGLFSIFLSYGGADSAAGLIGIMTSAVFTSFYTLLGAAAWISVIGAKRPFQNILAGLSAVFLFISFPFILLLLGIGDQLFHIRTLPHTQKREEE